MTSCSDECHLKNDQLGTYQLPKSHAFTDHKWEPGMAPELSLKTTLVVVPDNLREQWLEELRTHVRPGALKW